MITCQKFDLRDLNDFLATMWGGRRIKAKPFLYPVNFGAIAAGASLTETLTIAGDSDFVFTSSYIVLRNSGGTIIPAVGWTLLITDSGTNEKYTDSAAQVPSYCNDVGNSNANRAFIALPIPRRLARQTTLSLTLANVSGADADVCTIVLEGLRVWEYSQ